MKRLSILILLLILLTGTALGDAGEQGLSVRSFQLRYRQAEQTAAVIKPLLSSEGSFSIQPATNALIVTDRASNLKEIAAAIEGFDAPPRPLVLQLKLVFASRGAAQTRVPDDLKEIAAKLSGVLRFNNFEKAGEVTINGKEGDSEIARVDGAYRAEFRFGQFDPLAGSIRLNEFQLSKIQGNEKESQLVPLLNTTDLNLREGQTVVLGVSRQPDSGRALMLVLVAKRTGV